MNYSTLKKTVVLSFVSLMVVGMASAQTDTSKSMKKMTMSDSVGTPKLFGGAKQYNTWSVGVNIGASLSNNLTGGVNAFNKSDVDFGYGVSVRDQLSHLMSIQFDYRGGQISGNDGIGSLSNRNDAAYTYDAKSNWAFSQFKTTFNSLSLSGVINIGSVSALHRKNNVIFFVSGGMGFDYYKPDPYTVNGGPGGSAEWLPYGKTVSEFFIPVGAGVKFKLTDQLDLNFGYTENFVDGFNLTGVHAKYPSDGKYSYGYGGLEYTFGSKSKSSLEWANPVAIMYDELYDEALRKEVEALKGRVTNVETAIADLKKDSDGDGVSDQFDKCPGTPAGSIVDGAGCPIVFPKPAAADSGTGMGAPKGTAYGKIQFEFDSSVLKTTSYPVLDATAADLKSTGTKVIVAGYASSEGTAVHNLRLSRDRANSVKTYLVNSGVDPKHLKIKAYGETNPVADNSTEEGRVANRRVEFHK